MVVRLVEGVRRASPTEMAVLMRAESQGVTADPGIPMRLAQVLERPQLSLGIGLSSLFETSAGKWLRPHRVRPATEIEQAPGTIIRRRRGGSRTIRGLRTGPPSLRFASLRNPHCQHRSSAALTI